MQVFRGATLFDGSGLLDHPESLEVSPFNKGLRCPVKLVRLGRSPHRGAHVGRERQPWRPPRVQCEYSH